MGKLFGWAAAAGVLFSSAAAADPGGSELRQVTFSRIVVGLSLGEQWGTLASGLLCIPVKKLTWRGDKKDLDDDAFVAAFRTELSRAGVPVAGSSDNLFAEADEDDQGDLAVGANIRHINARFCAPLTNLNRWDLIKGESTFDVEWQVYSRLQRRLVAKITTTGHYTLGSMSSDGDDKILTGGFAEAAKALAASEEFRTAISGASEAAPQVSTAALTPIPLKGLARGPRTIADASGSVVAIFAGDSLGSGFLVSADGLLITNRHVVGAAKFVKVRWSDGFETVGEVLRSDAHRDVALVKTEPHGRAPLALHRASPQPGDTVFAVGTPLDPKLQNTVTKGIVSANRIRDGLAFIQSDVAIDHGNSGGPLLDEKGAVVGVAVLRYGADDLSHDINFFIPIGDALDFLKLQPPAA